MANKLFLLLAATLYTLGAVAQKDTAQRIRFGVEFGPNLSGGIFLKANDGSPKGSPGVGFELGVVAEKPLSANWSFRPRLQFADEGFTNKVYGDNFPIRATMLKLPLDFVYRSPKQDNPWFFGAGPYVAMGLGGKYTFFGTESNVQFGANGEAKRFDVGLDLLAGYRLKDNIILSANLNFGFINLLNENYWGSGTSGNSLNFGITGTYVFGSSRL